MTTTEHLARIRARCVELLELSSKRTPGKWQWDFQQSNGFHRINNGKTQVAATDLACSKFGQRETDATFIASCAGPAEAGWRATIAAIDLISAINKALPHSFIDLTATHDIIAAWPEELL